MDNQPSQLEPTEPKKSWIATHMILGYVFLFAVIAAAVAGIYYIQIVRQVPTSVDVPIHKDATTDWKTYTNAEYGFEFKYPDSLIIKEDAKGVTVYHGVPYTHTDPCDFRDGSQVLNEVIDFNARWQMFNQDVESTVKANYASPKDIIENGKFKLSPDFVDAYSAGDIYGYRVKIGAEGCGLNTYYFVLDNSHTLVVSQQVTPERTPLIADYEKFLSLPGIIKPADEEKMFNQILSTFKFIGKKQVSDWNTFSNSELGFEFEYPKDWVMEKLDFPFYFNSVHSADNKTSLNINIGANNYSGRLEYKTFTTIFNNKPVTVSLNQFHNGIDFIPFPESRGAFIEFDKTILNIPDLQVDKYTIHYSFTAQNEEQAIPILTQILNSFKAIDSGPNIKTYVDKELGFQFNYPKDAKVYRLIGNGENNSEKTIHFQIKSLTSNNIVYELRAIIPNYSLYYSGDPLDLALTNEELQNKLKTQAYENMYEFSKTTLDTKPAATFLGSIYETPDTHRLTKILIAPINTNGFTNLTIIGPNLKYNLSDGKYVFSQIKDYETYEQNNFNQAFNLFLSSFKFTK